MKYLVLLLFLPLLTVQAQEGVSGYINTALLNEQEKNISLSLIDISNNSEKPIGNVAIKPNGYFSFSKKHFTKKNQIYKIAIHVSQSLNKKSSQTEPTVNKLTKKYRLFILSNKDSLKFTKSPLLFNSYTTTNTADKEWQRLRIFDKKQQEQSNSDTYLQATKSYTKDSLQILLVKLLSINELHKKQLLEKDLIKNTAYYLSLLTELKSSDLSPERYLFLENMLLTYSNAQTTKEYNRSLGINLLLIVVLGMGIIMFRVKKKNANPIKELSKQELLVKKLIEEGKSNKEIASELFVSISTIKSHITAIYTKLQISNRSELLLKK